MKTTWLSPIFPLLNAFARWGWTLSYKQKYLHKVLVNRLVKLAQKIVWMGELTTSPWLWCKTLNKQTKQGQTKCLPWSVSIESQPRNAELGDYESIWLLSRFSRRNPAGFKIWTFKVRGFGYFGTFTHEYGPRHRKPVFGGSVRLIWFFTSHKQSFS